MLNDSLVEVVDIMSVIPTKAERPALEVIVKLEPCFN